MTARDDMTTITRDGVESFVASRMARRTNTEESLESFVSDVASLAEGVCTRDEIASMVEAFVSGAATAADGVGDYYTQEELETFQKLETDAVNVEVECFAQEKKGENGAISLSRVGQHVHFAMRNYPKDHTSKREIEVRSGSYNHRSSYERFVFWRRHRGEPGADSDAIEEARRVARELLPAVYDAHAEALANAQGRDQNRRLASAFAEEHARAFQPSPADITSLASALLERSQEEVEPHGFLVGRPEMLPGLHRTKTPDEIQSAAARNKTLRVVTLEIESLRKSRERFESNLPELVANHLEEYGALFHKEFAARVPQVFAFYWPEVLHAWQLENAARLGVARALAKPLKDDDLAQRSSQRLREAVAGLLDEPGFRQAAPWPWPPPSEEIETDGMAGPLARLLGCLRSRFCPNGSGPAAELLNAIANSGRKRLAEWKAQLPLESVEPPPSPWQSLDPTAVASLIAQVLWSDRVRREIEREQASSPAVVAAVSDDLHQLWRSDVRQEELDLVARNGERLAWLVMESESDALGLFGAAGTLTFQRLIRWLPVRSFEAWRNGRSDTDIEVIGGYRELAKRIGAASKKAETQVRDALFLGQAMRRRWPDGSETLGLWTLTYVERTRSRPSRLVITLSPMLRPGYVHQLPKGPSRALVPVPPMLATFAGPNQTHAAQAALQWRVLSRFVEHRKQRAERGGVAISPSDWRSMAEQVGLPSRLVQPVLDLWTGALPGGPFLERIGSDLWTVADSPSYSQIRTFLADQAGITKESQRRGRAASRGKGRRPRRQ